MHGPLLSLESSNVGAEAPKEGLDTSPLRRAPHDRKGMVSRPLATGCDLPQSGPRSHPRRRRCVTARSPDVGDRSFRARVGLSSSAARVAAALRYGLLPFRWSLRAADDGLAFVFPVRRRGVCSLRSFLPLSPRLRLTLRRFAHRPLESLVFDPNLCQSGGHQNPILNSLNRQPNSRSGCQHEQRPTTARGNASKQRFFMNPLAKLPWIWVRSCSLTLGCWWTASLKHYWS
ncbi:hypothetical protein SEVIR_7G222700v4 [Setaria viridis]